MEYRDAVSAGDVLPPIDVFHDGATYWIADGFHRFYGHKEAGKKEIACLVHSGSVRDAILFACQSNNRHGARYTNEDKRNAVTILLQDSEWSKWSDRVIAEKCGVAHPLVGDVRRELEESSSCHTSEDAKTTQTIGKDGKARRRPAKPKKRKAKSSGKKAVDETRDEPVVATIEDDDQDANPFVDDLRRAIYEVWDHHPDKDASLIAAVLENIADAIRHNAC